MSKRKNKKIEKNQKDVITITELSYFLGLRKRFLERLIMLDVIEPLADEPEFSFPIDLIPQIERMIRLHDQLRVGWSSMALVLDLLNRIEEMEKRFKVK